MPLLRPVLPAVGLVALLACRLAGQTESHQAPQLPSPPDSAGGIDYGAALNAARSQGVTANNNAYVPLCLLLGPERIPELRDPDFLQALGITDTEVETATRLVSLQSIDGVQNADNPNAITEQFIDATSNPWTRDRYPILAHWVDANEQQLNDVAGAVQRPKFYRPLSKADVLDGLLVGVPVNDMQGFREIARLLAARALLSLGNGDLHASWQDFQTLRRMARVMGNGSSLFRVSGDALEDIAGLAVELLKSPTLSIASIRRYREEFAHLPRPAPLRELNNLDDRASTLGTIQFYSRQSNPEPILFSLPIEGHATDAADRVVRSLFGFKLDWQRVAQEVSQRYDSLYVAAVAATRNERVEALQKLSDDVDAAIAAAAVRDFTSASVEDRGTALGVAMFGQNLPRLLASLQIDDINAQEETVFAIALALAHYRIEHDGTYPKTLDALAPDYLKSVPNDLFSDQPLKYRSSTSGAVIYSVGPNGRDDGGMQGDVVVDLRSEARDKQ